MLFNERQFQCRTVLIVDDHADSAEALAVVLEMYGFSASTALTAEEAIRRLPAVKPDAVISDIALPKMDGLGFATLMRRIPAYRETCLVALSGYGGEYAERCREAGFDAYFLKPVAFEELAAVLTGP